MAEIKHDIPAEEVFRYMEGLDLPFQYGADFNRWAASYQDDVDGEGRRLFSRLAAAGAYMDGRLAGFVQYGRTAFGFSPDGASPGAIWRRRAERADRTGGGQLSRRGGAACLRTSRTAGPG